MSAHRLTQRVGAQRTGAKQAQRIVVRHSTVVRQSTVRQRSVLKHCVAAEHCAYSGASKPSFLRGVQQSTLGATHCSQECGFRLRVTDAQAQTRLQIQINRTAGAAERATASRAAAERSRCFFHRRGCSHCACADGARSVPRRGSALLMHQSRCARGDQPSLAYGGREP